MSGIVGLWNLDGRPLDPALLSAMSDALRHRGPDGDRQVVAGAMGFAHRHLWVTPEEVGEAQPLQGRRGVLLVMDGRVDNRDELIAALGLPRTASDAACVLAAYEAWGEGALQRLNGDFSLALYDPRSPCLLLVRDAIGLKPLYYHHNARFIAFASEIKGILPHPSIRCCPDEEGVADYLLLGWRPADRLDVTCFAGIRALPPAHLLRVTPDGVQAPRRYWDFDPGLAVRFATFGECAEAFRERFGEAVRRRVRSAYPVVVSVSGGLDSSAVFCVAETLRRAGTVACPALVGLSYTGAEGTTADERAYLDHIEQAYGVPIERTDLASLLGVIDGAEAQVYHSETPLLDSMWQITRRIQTTAASAGARRFVTGHWGDEMLHGTEYVVDLLRSFAWRTAWQHLVAFDQWFEPGEAWALRKQVVRELLRYHAPLWLLPFLKWTRRRLTGLDPRRRWLNGAFRRRALRFAYRPASIGRHAPTAHARGVYLQARMKYAVQCMEWNSKISALHGLDYATPFLDRDLIQFLMAVPGEIQNQGGVPRALVREGLAGILPDAIRQRRWKGDYTDPVNLGAARDLAAVRTRFAAATHAVERGYVDRRRVNAELDRLAPRLAGPDCGASWELTDLIGLESWLRVFFSQASKEAAA